VECSVVVAVMMTLLEPNGEISIISLEFKPRVRQILSDTYDRKLVLAKRVHQSRNSLRCVIPAMIKSCSTIPPEERLENHCRRLRKGAQKQSNTLARWRRAEKEIVQTTKRRRKFMADRRDAMYGGWWLGTLKYAPAYISRVCRALPRYGGVYPEHTRA
jgi:hypothetical protein